MISNTVIRLKTIFFDSSKLFSLQSRNSPSGFRSRKLSGGLLSLQFSKNCYRKISKVAHGSIAYHQSPQDLGFNTVRAKVKSLSNAISEGDISVFMFSSKKLLYLPIMLISIFCIIMIVIHKSIESPARKFILGEG
jgi:hypothetical protein